MVGVVFVVVWGFAALIGVLVFGVLVVGVSRDDVSVGEFARLDLVALVGVFGDVVVVVVVLVAVMRVSL